MNIWKKFKEDILPMIIVIGCLLFLLYLLFWLFDGGFIEIYMKLFGYTN